MIKRLPFFVCYGITLFSVFLYSFTQIDLNLTLSRSSIAQSVQKLFLQIGYFQRPLSTIIFLILIFLLFIFYLLFLRLAAQRKITPKQFWRLTGAVVAILLLSYPAFSHDIFNYMFDARIFTQYQLNPYYFKALDFPDDSWTRFMHWTHRNYPYGPSWIILTLPFSYLGFGKFLLTLLNFKILMAVSYLGSVYLIGKILTKINPQKQLLGMAFFALNPLVIIESLVSAHHDIVMMFFALLAIYLSLLGKRIYSFFSFVASAAIKYVTAPLAIFSILTFRPTLAIILSVFSLFYVTTKIEIQPWYFLWVLPFVALRAENRLFSFLAVGFSLGLLLRYAPFLYLGHWNDPVPQVKIWVTIVPVLSAFLILVLFKWREKMVGKH